MYVDRYDDVAFGRGENQVLDVANKLFEFVANIVELSGVGCTRGGREAESDKGLCGFHALNWVSGGLVAGL